MGLLESNQDKSRVIPQSNQDPCCSQDPHEHLRRITSQKS